MTSVQAGEVEAVHARTTEQRLRASSCRRGGPDRHPHHGAALHLPLQRQLDHEPDPGGVPGARILLQPLPGQAARARGRRGHHEPPTPWAFHPGHHPSYIDFFEQVLAETTDPVEIGKYEEAFATDPWYVHLYRTGNAYHGVHPFYMWYWCAHALDHLGAVIIVGGDRAAVRRMGFKPASHHGRRAGDGRRRRRARPVAHPPARAPAADGRRAVSALR